MEYGLEWKAPDDGDPDPPGDAAEQSRTEMRQSIQRWWVWLVRLPWQRYGQQILLGIQNLFAQGAVLGERSADPVVGRWMLLVGSSVLLLILMLWQWRLGLAVLVGSALMLVVYGLQLPDRWGRWLWLKQWLTTSNRPFLISVGAGLAGTLGTYTVASIWAESDQRWLATGAILQGLATLTILGLLLWEWVNRRQDRQNTQFDHHLADVASPDSFKRLVGVRRLQRVITQSQISPDQIRLAMDYLRLALDQESVPVVREAMLEALQGWGILRRLDQQGEPVPTERESQVHSSF